MYKCSICGGELTFETGDWDYIESGLPNVKLKDITLTRCLSCGDLGVSIYSMSGLHYSIALAIARKKTSEISSAEITFLRKYILGSDANGYPWNRCPTLETGNEYIFKPPKN